MTQPLLYPTSRQEGGCWRGELDVKPCPSSRNSPPRTTVVSYFVTTRSGLIVSFMPPHPRWLAAGVQEPFFPWLSCPRFSLLPSQSIFLLPVCVCCDSNPTPACRCFPWLYAPLHSLVFKGLFLSGAADVTCPTATLGQVMKDTKLA